jgi:hypothetical protein
MDTGGLVERHLRVLPNGTASKTLNTSAGNGAGVLSCVPLKSHSLSFYPAWKLLACFAFQKDTLTAQFRGGFCGPFALGGVS